MCEKHIALHCWNALHCCSSVFLLWDTGTLSGPVQLCVDNDDGIDYLQCDSALGYGRLMIIVVIPSETGEYNIPIASCCTQSKWYNLLLWCERINI